MLYLFPGRRLRVFAVTGTDGKTTTALLLHSILKTARETIKVYEMMYEKSQGRGASNKNQSTG